MRQRQSSAPSATIWGEVHSLLTLSMHLTAVRSLDKLLDSSNSYWYTVMKNKCWSIRLKINLRFFMPDWLALWKINGAWFNYAQKPANPQRAWRIFLLWTSKFCFFDWFTLEMVRLGGEKPLICFSNTITFLAASWPVFAKGMVEWGRRPCALWRGVFVCVLGGLGQFPTMPFISPFCFPLNIRLCLREVTLSDQSVLCIQPFGVRLTLRKITIVSLRSLDLDPPH